jgi:hypothetical protein
MTACGMNPPFGGRCGHVPWLERFLQHRNGVAVVRSYTSSAWFNDYAVQAHVMMFPRGKTKFIRPDGTIGRAPGHGVVLLGMGEVACDALINSRLGWWCKPHITFQVIDRPAEGSVIAIPTAYRPPPIGS